MSNPHIPLDLFVKESSLWFFDNFKSNNGFDYLGKALEVQLSAWLELLGVGPAPMILGKVHPSSVIEGRVYIAEGAHVEPHTYIQGPTIIGPQSEVRHGAYIRGNVFVGRKCVVGHTTEVKGSLFFDEAKAGHFAYVGDSILGFNVNLGAGTKLANLKIRGREVSILDPNTNVKIGSGLRKFGSIVGDHAQTGCNTVLSPGSLLLPNTAVMPALHFQGTLKTGVHRGP